MCGQSVSLWKLKVAVLTADKVEGGCLNANAWQKSQQFLSSLKSRDEAQEVNWGVWWNKGQELQVVVFIPTHLSTIFWPIYVCLYNVSNIQQVYTLILFLHAMSTQTQACCMWFCVHINIHAEAFECLLLCITHKDNYYEQSYYFLFIL